MFKGFFVATDSKMSVLAVGGKEFVMATGKRLLKFFVTKGRNMSTLEVRGKEIVLGSGKMPMVGMGSFFPPDVSTLTICRHFYLNCTSGDHVLCEFICLSVCLSVCLFVRIHNNAKSNEWICSEGSDLYWEKNIALDTKKKKTTKKTPEFLKVQFQCILMTFWLLLLQNLLADICNFF